MQPQLSVNHAAMLAVLSSTIISLVHGGLLQKCMCSKYQVYTVGIPTAFGSNFDVVDDCTTER